MAEIRFQIDDDFLKALQEKTGSVRSTDVARDALTLLNWAVGERSQGREISSSVSGEIKTTVAMPALQNVKLGS